VSAEQGSKTTQQPQAEQPQGAQIQDLMQAAKAAPKPDLDSEALRAAEAALAAGERALAQAREARGLTAVRTSRLRERLLRLVLVINLMLMVVVLALPERIPGRTVKSPAPVTEPAPAPAVPVHSGDLYDQALRAAADNDYSQACALLEQWLEQNPRMHPSQQCNAFHALSWYWLKLGNLQKSQDYDQKAAALVRSSTLPEDLVQMAQQAQQRGDSEALRRLWARFLLQQRQVPASMYGHVAEAYLELGDSYRTEAGKAAEAARVRELEELRARMQSEAAAPPGKR
jgi:hypothetical protein